LKIMWPKDNSFRSAPKLMRL